ncbi:MAG: Uma2 family endonuclease [Microcoleus sp. PH2017_07_MST_O_A]|nr:Uma2 family endonuclease [Microcoleus sp. PH2017_07_MST_O_A]
MVQTFTQLETISLEVPNSIALTVTGDQFEALVFANPDLRLERTAQGELIVNPPTGGESSSRNLSISGQLGNWCETHEDLGEGFDSSGGFILPNGATRSPDASWVSRARWEASTLQTKMREYIDNGARLGWLIDPQNRRVEIYRQQAEVEILANPTELSGEDVLPGFVLNLRRVWR